ncbi:1-aminocyclopropane-1-carboxylate deaminase/D-cysteine desulfhydrase [Yoonia sp. 2307UL14-13]|uniref:1-aminocyclopropane-1-carboxylate deaminase/D-cysteine desulfhydrase n=1 Tax=Yoonia sp. 2307UL14-13 TaxID=3126506 RepID=UPI0030998465
MSEPPKISLLNGPTPLMPLPRLSDHLGGPDIWIKREDLTPIAGGGNKLRKLEYIAADARLKDCDTLVTIGAAQSNHVRQTMGVARALGMQGVGILVEEVAGSQKDKLGNVQLDQLLGAELNYRSKLLGYDELLCQEVDGQKERGRRPYPIPAGGSTALGCLGSIDLAEETDRQLGHLAATNTTIILATGTGGSQAGFISYAPHAKNISRVIGLSVGATEDRQREKVEHCIQALQVEGYAREIAASTKIEIADAYRGPSYGVPDQATWQAIRLVAELEGIFLDPIYTGKAMAGLIDLVRNGDIPKNGSAVFIHTGGVPVLPAFELEETER